ncbi:MAG: response regulator [Magnetococcales bacterium]|nr:response regulator [Magnetococcales bacterium]
MPELTSPDLTSPSRPTILVVDDTPENLTLMSNLLREFYTVKVATRGEKALRIAAGRERPDLILLDILMPGMDGYEVMRQLQASPDTAEIPVIFFTAMDNMEDEETGLALGAVDYLTKPVSPPRALARIRNHLHLKQARDLLKNRNETLEETVAKRTRDLSRERAKLARLVQVGIDLSSELDEELLRDSVLSGAMEISGADGGILLLRTPLNELSFSLVRADSLGIRLGGRGKPLPPFPKLALFDPNTGAPNHSHIAQKVAHSRVPINVADLSLCQENDYSSLRRFDKLTGYHSQSLLVLPLSPRGGEVVGVLQLLNAHDPESGQIIPFSTELQSIMEALAAQAAIALDNQNLISTQRRLLDSFVEVISVAIDAKSPYTGGHCSRVAEISRLLAETAAAQTEGPLADFSLDRTNEWREFRFAALLHDCGKIVTPESVVDKATKLETIHNRIHEIRTRFEVLWRDAEIAHWRRRAEDKERAEGKEADPESVEELAALHQTLQEEFAFVAECNIGGEFMSDQRIERLKTIAKRRWLRHFDDCLGLSHEELMLRQSHDRKSLPAEEFLLADRPEHIVPRLNPHPFGDNPWGFKIEVPDSLYNRGELYNLSISRGTLTPEDRYIISEHAVQTFAMLSRMPFPPGLERVPEYAGSHHEALNGKGYPRRLAADSLSVPARILAVADIFEALTACDRPYKKAKTLSEALKIMSFMAKDGHIDPDILALLVKEGIAERYARQFLRPEQCDLAPG